MTVLPWPADPKSRQSKAPRKMLVDPLPQSVLHALVRDLPGQRGETEPERAARFDAQLAEAMSYQPRNTAEAMMATHCIVLRLMAEDSLRDAARPDVGTGMAKKFKRQAKQFETLLSNMRATLARRQTQPLGKIDPAMALSLGLGQFLIPDPDDPDQLEEAFSATIVPLHPAPKMLQ
jgi:hypothetical protein